MEKQKPVLVFLIRFWPAENGGEPAWRASVEFTASRERQVFACPEDLFAFLRQQIIQGGQPPAGERKDKWYPFS